MIVCHLRVAYCAIFVLVVVICASNWFVLILWCVGFFVGCGLGGVLCGFLLFSGGWSFWHVICISVVAVIFCVAYCKHYMG